MAYNTYHGRGRAVMGHVQGLLETFDLQSAINDVIRTQRVNLRYARVATWTSSGLFRRRPSIPPSTINTCPVTWPDTADEDNSTTCVAISIGSATFLNGVLRITVQQMAISKEYTNVRCEGLINHVWVLQCTPRHRSSHPSWGNAVHPASRGDRHNLILQGQR